MEADFFTLPDRSGTNSLKWDNILPGKGDPIPLWVADMDFAAPEAVVKALVERAKHPVYGYTNLPEDYRKEVAAWNRRRMGRNWPAEAFLMAPSVLHAMSMAVRAFTKQGDRILNLPPIYYPFYKIAEKNDREIIDVPLVRRDKWTMDFQAIEETLLRCRDEGKPVAALLFCAPHNPTGRVWTEEELLTISNLAIKFDFLILCDEIHADLIQPQFQHRSPLDFPQFADRTLVFAGPNKTFNLAGLPISHVVALDESLRRRMRHAIEADFYDQPNVLSLAAAWEGYRSGEPWLKELLHVVGENKATLDAFLDDQNRRYRFSTPLRSEPLEATYLAWVDASAWLARLGLSDDRRWGERLEREARVKLTCGSIFRTGGERHLRFNLATPNSVLKEGLTRIAHFVETATSNSESSLVRE